MGVYSNNRTLLREGSSYEYARRFKDKHIMDFVIESHQDELNLFNTILENDFIHAYNESGAIYLTEEEEKKKDEGTKKSIWQRIKDFFGKIVDAIRGFFGKAKKKLEDTVNSKNHEELFKKYKDVVQKNGVGYQYKTKLVNVEALLLSSGKIGDVEVSDIGTDINSLYDTIEEGMKKVKDITPGEAKDVSDKANAITEDYKKKTTEVIEKYKKVLEVFEEEGEEKTIIFTQKHVDAVIDEMKLDENKSIAMVNSLEKGLTSALESDAHTFEMEARQAGDGEEKDLYVANAVWSYLNKLMPDLTALSQILVSLEIKEFAIFRKIFSVMGEELTVKTSSEKKEENKEEDKSNTNNASEDNTQSTGESYVEMNPIRRYVVEQLSDMYCERVFSMVN